jgi:hypothetical protein
VVPEESVGSPVAFNVDSPTGDPGALAVVLQKRVTSKVGTSRFAFFPSNVYSYFIQVAALFARNHPTQRTVVLPLRLILPRFGGDDVRTGSGGRPFDDQLMDAEI